MDRTDMSLVALRRILRATELYGRELAQAAGLTPAQFRVLQVVAETDVTTPKAISARMGVSQATMTALLDKLERHGMLRRSRSSLDRRQMNVELTERGHVAVAEAPDALQQRYVRQFEALQDWEQAMIVAALERVAALLDADSLDAAPVLTTGDMRELAGQGAAQTSAPHTLPQDARPHAPIHEKGQKQ